MIGVGVTVAATAAVLLPTGSAPPVEEAASEGAAPVSRPIAVGPGPTSGSSESVPVVQNNFAPIDRGHMPRTRDRKGPLRAPEASRTSEVRRPMNAVAGENALANTTKAPPAKPAPVTPALATTTTTGAGGGPRQVANRNHPSAGGAQQNAQAQLEQRRQELESARRQRLQQVRGPVGGAGGVAQRDSLNNANQNASGENGGASPNGAPSINDLIRNNPWLADYAPGGRYASSGNTTGGASNSGSNSGLNSGSNNSGNLGNSGSNSSGSTGGNTGGGGRGGTVVGGNGGVSPAATVAGFRWLPVDNRACGATLNGFRTNDLYVRLDVAAPVLGISTETNPLTIAGGSFYQATGTGDGLPTTGALAAGPCVQFDTYLNSGTSFSLIGGTAGNPVFTPTTVNGSLFNFAGVRGRQDTVVFGDNGFYVFFGRFTAASAISSLTGKLNVDTGVPGTTSFRSFVVDLTFDSTVWAFNAAFGLPGAAGGGQGPGSFSLTLPGLGAADVPLTPVFAWSAATGAIDFELTIDTDAAFAMPHTFRATTATTSLAIPGATLSNGTVYHWRVVARNAAGTTASTPASASFTTAGTPPGGGPPDDDDETPGGETPGGTPDLCANQAPGITAVWRPIDNGACANEEFEVDLANFATADLYVRMATTNSQSTIPPFSLQFVSAEVSGSPPMTLGNGAFFEHSSATGAAGNLRPALVNTNAVPCLAFDTYVTIDTGLTETPSSGAPGFQPLPQMILPPGVSAFTATGVRGLWVVPGFGASSALPAAKDLARFPSDPCGYYVRVGRLTITRGATLSGTLLVAFVLPGSGATTTAEVTVPNCVACWGQPAPPPPTP